MEVKSGETFTPHGRKLRVLDLPGCYSLRANSPDEKVALDALNGQLPGEQNPDLVVCVVDASNLERHLQLALQVIELGLPCVLALNMVDVAERTGLRLDPAKLSEELGIPVVPMQANAKKGVVELKQALRFPHPLACRSHLDLGRCRSGSRPTRLHHPALRTRGPPPGRAPTDPIR